MSHTIHPRPGVEVYVNEGGTISIKQLPVSEADGEQIVAVHPDDLDELITILKAAADECHQGKK